MSSYYQSHIDGGYVHVTEPDEGHEVRCSRCHGSGLVLVHGQETDCIDCEGYGSVYV